ncbi:hypothetical protein GCM10007857_64740 [Bradyrhizobium iriomotense]|uniref:NB-ARC domain-containing protein n=1 Tax=Bradyrhizobium iriomotense TaxID=441950 RepID=A0ABQ6B7W1_9BRAD|nr:hypothetical protein GCM10007857_64740 [Bradyrhizobium iriomotense]
MGGIGKSALAVEYAYRYRDHYDGVWWCAARLAIDQYKGLTELGIKLGILGAEEPNGQAAARRTLEHLTEKYPNFLLIYDDLQDQKSLLLPTEHVRVLLTSRIANWISLAQSLSVDVLAPPAAVEFLEIYANREGDKGGVLLAGVLGRLPLALEHAAAYCLHTGISFADYAERAKSLIQRDPLDDPDAGSVYATFKIAIGHVAKGCAAATSVMEFLGCCGHDRIPGTLVEGAAADQGEREVALIALSRMSLIKNIRLQSGAPAVSVHRVVQLVARSIAELEGRDRQVIDQIMMRLLAVFPADDYQDKEVFDLCLNLMPHLLVWRDTQSGAPTIGKDGSALLGRAISAFVVQTRAIPDVRSKIEPLRNLIRELLGLDPPGADPLPDGIDQLVRGLKTIYPDFPATRAGLANLIRTGRIPNYRQTMSALECNLEIFDEIVGPEAANVQKLLRLTTYFVERHWRELDRFFIVLQQFVGLHP